MLRLPGAHDGKSLQPHSAEGTDAHGALGLPSDWSHQGSPTARPLPNTCHGHAGPLIDLL